MDMSVFTGEFANTITGKRLAAHLQFIHREGPCSKWHRRSVFPPDCRGGCQVVPIETYSASLEPFQSLKYIRKTRRESIDRSAARGCNKSRSFFIVIAFPAHHLPFICPIVSACGATDDVAELNGSIGSRPLKRSSTVKAPATAVNMATVESKNSGYR